MITNGRLIQISIRVSAGSAVVVLTSHAGPSMPTRLSRKLKRPACGWYSHDQSTEATALETTIGTK